MDINNSDKNVKTLLIVDDDPRVCRSLAGRYKIVRQGDNPVH